MRLIINGFSICDAWEGFIKYFINEKTLVTGCKLSVYCSILFITLCTAYSLRTQRQPVEQGNTFYNTLKSVQKCGIVMRQSRIVK